MSVDVSRLQVTDARPLFPCLGKRLFVNNWREHYDDLFCSADVLPFCLLAVTVTGLPDMFNLSLRLARARLPGVVQPDCFLT